MTKIAKIVLGRMSSTRLPNKSAVELGGKPMFEHVFERTEMVKADYEILAMSYESPDDVFALLGKAYGRDVYRGPMNNRARLKGVVDYLGLADDDIMIWMGCDAPFVITDWMPQALEEMEGYDGVAIVEEEGTFLEACSVPPLRTVRGRFFDHGRIAHDTMCRTREDFAYGFRFGKWVIVHIDDLVLQRSWPCEPLTVDYPVQLIAIKLIYNCLYAGRPIDARDAYLFVSRSPFMQRFLAKQGLLIANQATFPMGFGNTHIDEIKQYSDGYKEITYKGGEYDVDKVLPNYYKERLKKEKGEQE